MIQKSILFLAAVFLLSACSSNFSLMKRRYTKGVYVSSSKKSSVPKQHTDARYAAIHAPEQLPAAVIKSTPEQVAPEQTVSSPANPYKEAAASRKATAVKAEPVAAAKPVKDNNAYSSASTIEALHQSAKSKHADSATKTAANSDARFIVMVILCFFWWLNLISVYMHDDAITLNFWITLLLDFTLIGGIIFSLLVVLDVVDLR